jgi:predicted nuclease of predicted toxin-antitoxin system
MRLLIDENVQDSIARLFRDRGHEVSLVRDVFLRGEADPVIAQLGDSLGMIVVTWDKGFRQLAKRAPHGERQRFRNLSRLTLRCNQARAVERVQRYLELIEFEFDQAQRRGDKRLLVEITETTIVFL